MNVPPHANPPTVVAGDRRCGGYGVRGGDRGGLGGALDGGAR